MARPLLTPVLAVAILAAGACARGGPIDHSCSLPMAQTVSLNEDGTFSILDKAYGRTLSGGGRYTIDGEKIRLSGHIDLAGGIKNLVGKPQIVFKSLKYGQGLVADGTYFYFGHSNGKDVDGVIYKYSYDGTYIADFPAPIHASEGDYRADHRSLIWAGLSTSEGWKNQIWEIDPESGRRLRRWVLTGLPPGYISNKIAYVSPGQFLVLLSRGRGYRNFKLAQARLNDDGSFMLGKVWDVAEFLGTIQGMDYKDGDVWLASDGNKGTLYRLTLLPDGTTSVQNVQPLPGTEREGLSWDGEHWYYGDGFNIVRLVPCLKAPRD
jgi:hypothetical protein